MKNLFILFLTVSIILGACRAHRTPAVVTKEQVQTALDNWLVDSTPPALFERNQKGHAIVTDVYGYSVNPIIQTAEVRFVNFTYHDEAGQTKTFTGSGYLNMMKEYGLDANQAKWRIDSMSLNDEHKEIKAFRPSKDFEVK